MRVLSLNGQWNVECSDRDINVEGNVPGDVYLDLLNARVIEDPFYRANEIDLQWIGRSDWVYSRTFTVTPELMADQRVLLSCDGLDTIAGVEINGQLVGTANNMHRTWEWDADSFLKEGENTICITFASAVKYALKANERDRPLYWDGPDKNGQPCSGNAAPFQMIRKQACNFGWDWGTHAVTCGIWRDIKLIGFSAARIDHLRSGQVHDNGTVWVTLGATLERLGETAFAGKATLTRHGETIAEGTCAFQDSEGSITFAVKHPALWWPNNMGEQPLYDLKFALLDANGSVLDERTQRIGLRTVKLDRHPDEWGESFQFVINGVVLFAKGANWIPVDALLSRASPGDYERLLKDAVAVNMNMIRVWGGGIYEPDHFYETCSQLGILVWQDFQYACNAYPLDDPSFFDNAVIEAEEQVKRLHHHASLALWCGNNEMESFSVGPEWTDRVMSWADYCALYDEALPSIVSQHSPNVDYWSCSPHSPVGDRSDTGNPCAGDAHLWAVWHGKEPFEWYRTSQHRFCSEYGFQSFPEPKTVYGYTEPPDRNITSFVMEHHQRSGIGNTTIMQYMLAWYRLPLGFENTLWVSQILQGMAITYAVEHWRRNMPRTMGNLYWQLNDYWPVASWASIDYHGRWKALHYMARRFYAPVLVSGVEDMKNGTAEIYVTSDRRTDTNGVLRYAVTDLMGANLYANQSRVFLKSGTSKKVMILDIANEVGRFNPRTMILWLELETDTGETSSNLLLFARPKHMELADPAFEKSVTDNRDGSFTLTLESKAVALWTWLELSDVDARFSDNFIHVRPGKSYTIDIRPSKPLSRDQVQAQLNVRSLVNTF